MRRMILAALAVTCFGCQGDDPPADSQPDAPSAANQIAARPEVRQDTIMIEGMPQPSTATLFTTPDEFAVNFSTYVPEGIEVEADDEGIRFVAVFGGDPEPLAYMYVSPYPLGTELRTVRNRVGGFLRSRTPSSDPVDTDDYPDTWERVDAPAWAVEAYAFAYPQTVETQYAGRVLIGRHDDRFFHVIVHYPVEYGDGLVPRFEAIIDDWRWEDTGHMLRSGPAN